MALTTSEAVTRFYDAWNTGNVGRAVEVWYLVDWLGALRQRGVLPPMR